MTRNKMVQRKCITCKKNFRARSLRSVHRVESIYAESALYLGHLLYTLTEDGYDATMF